MNASTSARAAGPCTTVQLSGTGANVGHSEYCFSSLTSATNSPSSSSKGIVVTQSLLTSRTTKGTLNTRKVSLN